MTNRILSKSLQIVGGAGCLVALVACGAINSAIGNGAQTTAPLTGAKSVARSGPSSTPSPTSDLPISGTPTKSELAAKVPVIDHLLKFLGDEAVFSVSALQGTPSPLCPNGKGVSSAAWDLDEKKELTCFAFERDKTEYTPEKYRDLMSLYGGEAVKPDANVSATSKVGEVLLLVRDGRCRVSENGTKITLLSAPLTANFEGDNNRRKADQNMEHACDWNAAKFDIITPNKASAQGINLASEKLLFVTKAITTAKTKSAAQAKEAAEKLAGVNFPATVSVDAADSAVRAMKARLSDSRQSEIDPALVKKLAVTAPWRVTKSGLGLILYRDGYVSVGFARKPEQIVNPADACAFTTFMVRQNWNGSRYEEAAYEGFAGDWTNISCERLR
jgi:hypothetical protein